MPRLLHPTRNDITLPGVLEALADPQRLKILRCLMRSGDAISCSNAAPCPDMAKSTLSHHFRILREAGLIHTAKVGVENRNTIRTADIEARFPGLLKTIMKYAD